MINTECDTIVRQSFMRLISKKQNWSFYFSLGLKLSHGKTGICHHYVKLYMRSAQVIIKLKIQFVLNQFLLLVRSEKICLIRSKQKHMPMCFLTLEPTK